MNDPIIYWDHVMDELLEEFIAETRDTLETLSSQLVQWERTPDDSALFDSVFRFVHTVKGSCGFLDLPRFMRLSHAAEDVLSSARDGELDVSADLVTAILAVIDRIGILTDALQTGRAVFDDDDVLIQTMMDLVTAPTERRSSRAGNDQGRVSNQDGHGEDIATEARVKSRSVRISLSLIDNMMNGISDMVLARNEVSRQLRASAVNAEIEYAFDKLSASVADMRDAVGQMRMQNIDRLFASLPRLMRDIEQDLGKEIELQIEGSEVEVDREMAEALRDPLIHVLRNAADHGIESAEVREAAGKARAGLIRVSARQSGNQIVVEITDDGRGIDVEKLGLKAISAKLIDHEEWQQLSDQEKLGMIFMPGLSTAENISAISGRGVGMDVVRNNIQAVGGAIDIDNYPGQGLKITLRLPLTLTIISGLSVQAGNQHFGIPRNSVVEILSTSNTNVQIKKMGHSQIALIRGNRYPYARLEDLLEIEEKPGDLGTSRTLVVIRPAVGRIYVLDVAAVIDTEELVIKPAAPIIMAAGIYAGTSLPDTGLPILLLDMSGIAEVIGIENDDYSFEEKEYENGPVEIVETEKHSALLFRGLDGRKQAIRFTFIERIEDLPTSQIIFSGGKWRMMNDGKLFDITGLTAVPERECITLLLLSDGQNRVYFAVDDVIDIFALHNEIEPSATPELHEGVIIIFDEAVELLNIFQFFETSGDVRVGDTKKGICFIECGKNDHWERQILAPLLNGSGYQVSFDSEDRKNADIVLRNNMDGKANKNIDGKTICLRDDILRNQDGEHSIYRYDRVGLLAAIEQKLAGVR